MNKGMRELSIDECVHVSGGTGGLVVSGGRSEEDNTGTTTSSDGTDTSLTGGGMGSGS